MRNDLIISSDDSQVNIALLEENRLVELHQENESNQFAVGDIYLGRVRKLAPGLNAAFVDVGYEKDAFLHYFDLGPQASSLMKWTKQTLSGKSNTPMLSGFEPLPDIDKGGNIKDVLSPNQHVLVQITKEPISTKGPRISCELTLAGRYMVLVPFSDRISVSQKVGSRKEKDRLKRLIQSIRPKNFGVIVRTVAEGKKVAELDADMRSLTKKWQTLFKQAQGIKPPQVVLGEVNRTNAILRDYMNASFTQITIDSEEIFNQVHDYLGKIAPDKQKIVKQYRGTKPVFEVHGVERQIKSLFGKHVTMPSGAYLVIEHTEALHVVDVNSGNTAKAKQDQETNALQTNLESAVEIARQLRLRDIGGIIVIDFIDMKLAANRKAVYEKLVEQMKLDRAKHNILPISKFGLIQITRQRVRPEMSIKTAEVCPTCNGTGEIQASILIIDQIENKFSKLIQSGQKDLVLNCHPFVANYLTSGYPSLRSKWMIKYKKRLKVVSFDSYGFLDYRFVNSANEEYDVASS